MHKLPFKGTVRSVVCDADGVHVDMVIEDADGNNVQSHPFSTGAKRTAAEVCEMAQSAVSGFAKSYHARELAALDAPVAKDASKEGLEAAEGKRLDDLKALVGQTFTGSVTR